MVLLRRPTRSVDVFIFKDMVTALIIATYWDIDNIYRAFQILVVEAVLALFHCTPPCPHASAQMYFKYGSMLCLFISAHEIFYSRYFKISLIRAIMRYPHVPLN